MTAEPFALHLLPGEEIIWRGRPAQGLLFRWLDLVAVPLCVFFVLVGNLVVRIGLMKAQDLLFAKVMAGFWVLLSVILLFGRFVIDWLVRSRTFYALTDRRILILRKAPSTKLTSLNLASLPDMHFHEHWRGRGTVVFGDIPPAPRGSFYWVPSLIDVPQFIKIKDASNVFRLIQERASNA